MTTPRRPRVATRPAVPASQHNAETEQTLDKSVPSSSGGQTSAAAGAGAPDLSRPQAQPRVRRVSLRDYSARIAEIETYVRTAKGDDATILAGYRRLRQHVPLARFAHPESILRRAIAMLPEDRKLTMAALHELVGGSLEALSPTYAAACALRGEMPHHTSLARFRPADPLGPWLTATLGPLPQTALAAHGGAQWPNAGLRASLAIHAFRVAAVRLVAGVALQLAAARGMGLAREKELVSALRHLDAAFATCETDAPEERDAALAHFLADRRYAGITRDNYRRIWRRELARVERYLAQYPDLNARYADWRFSLPAVAGQTLYEPKGPKTYAAEIADLEAYLETAKGSAAEILAGYRRRRAAIRVNYPHPERVLLLALEMLGPGEIPSHRRIRALIGRPVNQLPQAYAFMCQRLGLMPSGTSKADYRPADRLSPWLTQHLGTLPETSLDPDLGSLLTAPTPRRLARIAALCVPAVRLFAGLAIFFAAARGSKMQPEMMGQFKHLDTVLLAAGVPEGDQPAAVARDILLTAISAFMKDERCSPRLRTSCWTQWNRQLAIIDAYMLRFPALAARYAAFRLALPTLAFALEARRLAHRADADRKLRRDNACAPTAQDPGAIYRAYDTRLRDVAELRAHFDIQCALLEAGNVDFAQDRARFSVTLPRTRPDGSRSEGDCTLDFAVTTAHHLARRVPTVAAGALARAGGSTFLLEYLGPRDPADRLATRMDDAHASSAGEPPLLAMYRAGCFLRPIHASAEQLQRREQLLPGARWPQSPYAWALFNYIGRARLRLAAQSLRRGIILIPIHELHFALAVARALGRSILRGARIGEVMQQTFDPESFVPVTSREQTLWSYQAIAKARTVPEPYLLHERDMQAVLDVARVTRANGWSMPMVTAAHTLTDKCGRARFLYQRNGRALAQAQLSAALALPLWPGAQRSHDLRHGIARHLRHTGRSLGSIMALLHHRTPVPASSGPEGIPESAAIHGYVRPTRAMLTEMVEQVSAKYEETP